MKRGRVHGRSRIKQRLLTVVLVLIALVFFNTVYIWLYPASPVEGHPATREAAIIENTIRDSENREAAIIENAIRDSENRDDGVDDEPVTRIITPSKKAKHTEPTTKTETTSYTQEYVACETTAGKLMFELHPEWSPAAARRFKELVTEGFFSAGGGNAIFRYAAKFMIQFGIVGDPTFDDTPGSTFQAFPDDKQAWKGRDGHSNVYERGMLAFAASGPNTRNTELFIMLRDHSTGGA